MMEYSRFLSFIDNRTKEKKKNTHPNKSLAKAKMVEVFPVPGGP
jgi:hypothetical protein